MKDFEESKLRMQMEKTNNTIRDRHNISGDWKNPWMEDIDSEILVAGFASLSQYLQGICDVLHVNDLLNCKLWVLQPGYLSFWFCFYHSFKQWTIHLEGLSVFVWYHNETTIYMLRIKVNFYLQFVFVSPP